MLQSVGLQRVGHDLGTKQQQQLEEMAENKNKNELAISFSEFLEDVAPQYKENVVKAAEYIQNKLETEQ